MKVVDLLGRGGSAAVTVERRQIATGVGMLRAAVQSQQRLPPSSSPAAPRPSRSRCSSSSDDFGWKCDLCDRTFQSESARDQHCRDTGHVQPARFNWECGQCEKSFQSESARDQHRRDTGHLKPDNLEWKCGQCEKMFQSVSARDQHCRDTDHLAWKDVSMVGVHHAGSFATAAHNQLNNSAYMTWSAGRVAEQQLNSWSGQHKAINLSLGGQSHHSLLAGSIAVNMEDFLVHEEQIKLVSEAEEIERISARAAALDEEQAALKQHQHQ